MTSGNDDLDDKDDQDDHRDLNDLDGKMKVASQTIDRVVYLYNKAGKIKQSKVFIDSLALHNINE